MGLKCSNNFHAKVLALVWNFVIDLWLWKTRSLSNDGKIWLISLQMKEWQDLELSNLCQQILALQASMLREQKRVELLLKEKDAIIGQQKAELGKLSTALPSTSSPTKPNNVSVTSLSAGAFGGSLRIHGSFRQYKKDREKIRHFKSSSGDSGINISSEESSSSPTTLPRTQKQQLPDNAAGSVKKKSMILKPVEFGVSPGQQKSSGLTNLQQLIGNFGISWQFGSPDLIIGPSWYYLLQNKKPPLPKSRSINLLIRTPRVILAESLMSPISLW